MTKAQQTRFYFPLWNDVCRANDWIMVKGRLLGKREERFGHGEPDALYQKVWDAAETLAAKNHRAVTADDLRHACHIVALGKDASSHQLTSQQLNRVARLFKILKEPDDLGAMIAWTNPETDQRKDLVRWINSMAPDAYVCQVAKAWPAFTYPHWEDLPIDNLRSLARLIKKRTDDKNGKVIAPRAPSELATADVAPHQPPIDMSKVKEVPF